jgi:hypothetical protein
MVFCWSHICFGHERWTGKSIFTHKTGGESYKSDITPGNNRPKTLSYE